MENALFDYANVFSIVEKREHAFNSLIINHNYGYNKITNAQYKYKLTNNSFLVARFHRRRAVLKKKSHFSVSLLDVTL